LSTERLLMKRSYICKSKHDTAFVLPNSELGVHPTDSFIRVSRIYSIAFVCEENHATDHNIKRI
jgi:hypothetical protein